MARLLPTTIVLAALWLAAAAPSAEAWVVNTRLWNEPAITYRAVGPEAREAADYAAYVWGRTGVRFEPADRDANVAVRVAGRCGGEATIGYRFSGAFVTVGRCSRPLRALSAVHEFGHVLGLSHEDRVCARMNPQVAPSGTPRRCAWRPIRWWVAHPLTPDDVAGARFVRMRLRAVNAG